MRSSAKISESLVLAEVPAFRDSIVKRSIKDLIADKIAGLIASGILQVGDALPSERELAASLNVSRETIRGAIQILAVRGIIEISQGARTRVLRTDVGSVTIGFATVRAINAYDIESVHAARQLVERQVVADAARNIDAGTLEILAASLEAQSAAKNDPVRFLIADREFHVAIYRASGNPLLADFTADLYAYMMEYRRLAVARPGAIATSYQDHLAIFAALDARDPEATAAAFALHTERIYDTTRSVFGEPRRP
jgi:DNA-binding FadR family transcriptional regulator